MSTSMRIALVVVLFAMSASAASTNFTLYFGGGLSFCSQCGVAGQYACAPDETAGAIGNWNNGTLTFQDPLPSNAIPYKWTIEFHGSWSCSPTLKDAAFGIALNDIVHATRETKNGNYDCECNTCDAPHTLSFSHSQGTPKYVHGGTNRLRIDMFRNSICMNRIVVKIDYDSDVGQYLPHVFKSVPLKSIPGGQDVGCNVCNSNGNQYCTPTSSLSTTVSVNFTDPLPSGSLLIAADVYFSYNFVQRSYYSSNPTSIAVKLSDTAIGSSTFPDAAFTDKCGCYGDSFFRSPFYQRGLPGYTEGAVNNLYITFTKYYSATYGNMCVGQFYIDLIYTHATTGVSELQRMRVENPELSFE